MRKLNKSAKGVNNRAEMPETDENVNNVGLDCSGQGECQPNIEPSDTEEMQLFLVRANQKKSKKRG